MKERTYRRLRPKHKVYSQPNASPEVLPRKPFRLDHTPADPIAQGRLYVLGNGVLQELRPLSRLLSPTDRRRLEEIVRGGVDKAHKEGSKRLTSNAFCPTGPGGGIDPTCKPGGGPGGRHPPGSLESRADELAARADRTVEHLDDARAALGDYQAGTGLAGAAPTTYHAKPRQFLDAASGHVDMARLHLTQHEWGGAQSELVNALGELKKAKNHVGKSIQDVRGEAGEDDYGKQVRSYLPHLESVRTGVNRATTSASHLYVIITEQIGSAKEPAANRRVANAGPTIKHTAAALYDMSDEYTRKEATEIARAVRQGYTGGRPVEAVAREIGRRLGLPASQAEMLAVTETTRMEANDVLFRLGKRQRLDGTQRTVVFIASSNACPTCAALHGEEYTLAEANDVIPRHPHCQCRWQPGAGEQGVVGNVFCPTGEGGGIDPSCKAGGAPNTTGMGKVHFLKSIMAKVREREKVLEAKVKGVVAGITEKAMGLTPRLVEALPDRDRFALEQTAGGRIGAVATIVEAASGVDKASAHAIAAVGLGLSTRALVKAKAGIRYIDGVIKSKNQLKRAQRKARKLREKAARKEKVRARKATRNVFCPTGEGGGVDPSCSPGGGSGFNKSTSTRIDLAIGKLPEDVAGPVLRDDRRRLAPPLTAGPRNTCFINAAKEYEALLSAGGSPVYVVGKVYGQKKGDDPSSFAQGFQHAWVEVGKKIHDPTSISKYKKLQYEAAARGIPAELNPYHREVAANAGQYARVGVRPGEEGVHRDC